MNNQWTTLPSLIEEPSDDDESPMSLHAHVFGYEAESDGPSFESMPNSPAMAGEEVTEDNDSITDNEIGEIPSNTDSTLSEMLRRRNNRNRTQRRGRGDSRARERSRSRERTLNFMSRTTNHVEIDCPLCERSDITRKTLDDEIIQKCGDTKRADSLSAICKVAWRRLVTKDLNSGANYQPPTQEDVSHHALRCLGHPNIIVREQIDTWRGICQELTASAKIGTASSGATIYDPKYIPNNKVASEMLLKWSKVRPSDMEGFMAQGSGVTEKEDMTRVKQPLY